MKQRIGTLEGALRDVLFAVNQKTKENDQKNKKKVEMFDSPINLPIPVKAVKIDKDSSNDVYCKHFYANS